jgi:hypothetical protein
MNWLKKSCKSTVSMMSATNEDSRNFSGDRMVANADNSVQSLHSGVVFLWMDKGSGATRLSASSSKERARLSGVQLSSFSLSFDFFVSSSARVPVNVYDNLPVITELPKGTVISCVTSYGSEPDYYVHVGTSEVKKKKKKKN